MSSPDGPCPSVADFLDDQAATELKRLHKLTGIPDNELASKAVMAYGFLHTELALGARVHLRRPGGQWLTVEHW